MSLPKARAGDLAIGIDLGGTQIRAALIDRRGTIVRRASALTRADGGPDIVIGQMAELARHVSMGADASRIRGAGVSSPGPLDSEEGVALDIPTLKGFVNFPMGAALGELLALPVTLENDGIAAAIGEWRFGAARGLANVVYVTVSTGIGGGVIADNRVLRGRRGMAGHVGHMSFSQDGEMCFCGNRGCFEAHGSGSAFTRRAIDRATRSPTVLGANGQPIDAAAVFAASALGDEMAKSLVREEAQILGRGFASLLHLYSPEVIVMGGGLSNQFDALRDDMMASLRAAAMPPFRDTPVRRAGLGGDSGLIGAVSAFLSELPRPAWRPAMNPTSGA